MFQRLYLCSSSVGVAAFARLVVGSTAHTPTHVRHIFCISVIGGQQKAPAHLLHRIQQHLQGARGHSSVFLDLQARGRGKQDAKGAETRRGQRGWERDEAEGKSETPAACFTASGVPPTHLTFTHLSVTPTASTVAARLPVCPTISVQ